jgi:hypothetical protein
MGGGTLNRRNEQPKGAVKVNRTNNEYEHQKGEGGVNGRKEQYPRKAERKD